MDIDMRSDTVTRPSKAMRKAISEAEVGDDVFGDDPTTIALETQAAEILGKEAALYVPTGTMGNFLCIMSHCWIRGQEVLIGDQSHVCLYEQGNLAQFGGVNPRSLKNLPDGTFDLDELKEKIRPTDDPHQPWTGLVCIENTHNKQGGVALPMDWLEKLGLLCRELGLPLHCDGARIFNAAENLGVEAKTLLKYCDSVSVCLSKGLGAPVGSVIAGTKEIIDKARRLRKSLGGGMRQCGVIAAAGLYALENNVQRLASDRSHAEKVAKVIHEHGGTGFSTKYSSAHTNLLFVDVNPSVGTAPDFAERMAEVTSDEEASLGFGASVRSEPFTSTSNRFAFHLDITEDMVEKMIGKLVYVMNEMMSKAAGKV